MFESSEETFMGVSRKLLAVEQCGVLIWTFLEIFIWNFCEEKNKTNNSSNCYNSTNWLLRSQAILLLPNARTTAVGVQLIWKQGILHQKNDFASKIKFWVGMGRLAQNHWDIKFPGHTVMRLVRGVGWLHIRNVVQKGRGRQHATEDCHHYALPYNTDQGDRCP